MTAMAILSLYLSMPKCHGYHIEGWLLSYRVVHWKANAGLRLSYPATYNITCIILIQQHNNITIKGTRFKCSVREDYDLCESCQQKQTQPFPMVAIFGKSILIYCIYDTYKGESIFNYHFLL